MLFDLNHKNILLSFIRPISKANDPDQLLSHNKVDKRRVCRLFFD